MWPHQLGALSAVRPTHHLVFFSRLRRPPTSPLFPYTTLFRSPETSARAPPASGHRACRRRGTGASRPSARRGRVRRRSEEHTSELQSRRDLVCRLLLEKKKKSALPPARPRIHSARTASRRRAC